LMMHELNLASAESLAEYDPDCYMVLLGKEAVSHGLVLAEQIRDKLPGIKIVLNTSGQSAKSQFKKADKSKARIAVIVGDDEVKNKTYAIKWLQERKEQQQLKLEDLIILFKNN